MNSEDYDNYHNQRLWSDSYIPYVSTKILSALSLDSSWKVLVTTPEEDMKEAADLKLTNGIDDYMIALRLRNAKYALKYPNEFTIRNSYTNGCKTEFRKIMEGYGDLMFYGFRDHDAIPRWVFLNLDVFRDEHYYVEESGAYLPKEHVRHEVKENHDGRNNFVSYDLISFKNREGLVVAHSEGYFSDLKVKYFSNTDGSRSPCYSLKNKEDRIDGAGFFL